MFSRLTNGTENGSLLSRSEYGAATTSYAAVCWEKSLMFYLYVFFVMSVTLLNGGDCGRCIASSLYSETVLTLFVVVHLRSTLILCRRRILNLKIRS